MKKRILVLVFSIIASLSFAKEYKLFNGLSDGHIPTCQTIICPICHEAYMKGLSDGGIALRTMKQIGSDEDGTYLEYRCSHGHLVKIYYKIVEGKLVPLD